MKKTLSIILVLFVLGQCVILDPLGLTNDRIKGSEAASQIRSAAITQDLLLGIVLIGRPIISVWSIVADKLAGIDSGAYYLKSDVNKCVSDIKGFKGFVIGSTLTVLTSCKLDKPDGILLGDPLPKL